MKLIKKIANRPLLTTESLKEQDPHLRFQEGVVQSAQEAQHSKLQLSTNLISETVKLMLDQGEANQIEAKHFQLLHLKKTERVKDTLR